MKYLLTFIIYSLACIIPTVVTAQPKATVFGSKVSWSDLTAGNAPKGTPLRWFDVNTSPETWSVKGELMKSTGQPIGVMRSEEQYENFMLHIEWQHQEPGGNSGLFIWSAAKPLDERLPDGVEVQMLELDWVNLNQQQGEAAPIAYVHGELFGVGGVKTDPDNPRGERSKSVENRCKGKGEWNSYDVVCVDGVIKLSVNGKFVNGISHSTQKKGYICFESEGAPIHFRNLRIVTLAEGTASGEQVAPQIK